MRWVLMNPGPVNITPRVRRALLKPDICHREEEFSSILLDVRSLLLKIFSIAKTHTVAFFTGSGTSALEAMLTAHSGGNRRMLVLSNGVYGERMKTILEIHGIPVTVLAAGWDDFPKSGDIEAALGRDSSIVGVAMVHHETSTGRLNPLGAVGALAKKYGKFFYVDAVSSLGGEAVPFKEAGIDFCAGTAGKCLHGLPGVSFVILSRRAERELAKRKRKSLSLDLLSALEHARRGDTAFTPAVQIFYAFQEALLELKEEGLKNRLASYREKSELLEEGLRKLGFRFLVEKENRSHVLTAPWLPAGLSYDTLHDRLKKAGFVIYAGQSALKGRIFRVANLGDMGRNDIRRFLRVLGGILAKAR